MIIGVDKNTASKKPDQKNGIEKRRSNPPVERRSRMCAVSRYASKEHSYASPPEEKRAFF
jgi:hypothetical protein